MPTTTMATAVTMATKGVVFFFLHLMLLSARLFFCSGTFVFFLRPKNCAIFRVIWHSLKQIWVTEELNTTINYEDERTRIAQKKNEFVCTHFHSYTHISYGSLVLRSCVHLNISTNEKNSILSESSVQNVYFLVFNLCGCACMRVYYNKSKLQHSNSTKWNII